jgi:hypothetical protein
MPLLKHLYEGMEPAAPSPPRFCPIPEGVLLAVETESNDDAMRLTLLAVEAGLANRSAIDEIETLTKSGRAVAGIHLRHCPPGGKPISTRWIGPPWSTPWDWPTDKTRGAMPPGYIAKEAIKVTREEAIRVIAYYKAQRGSHAAS